MPKPKPIPACVARLSPDMQSHVYDLAPVFRPMVADLKRSMTYSLTQYGYGAYMSLLGTLVPSNDKRMLTIVCAALVLAGGDERGIKSALAIITGNDPLAALGI